MVWREGRGDAAGAISDLTWAGHALLSISKRHFESHQTEKNENFHSKMSSISKTYFSTSSQFLITVF